jgi:hypothetical protein
MDQLDQRTDNKKKEKENTHEEARTGARLDVPGYELTLTTSPQKAD